MLNHRCRRTRRHAKRDIGFVSEDMRLYGSLTLAWHMNFIRPIYPRWDRLYAENCLALRS